MSDHLSPARPTVYARDLHLAQNLSPEQKKMRDAITKLARYTDPHQGGYDHTETAEFAESAHHQVVLAAQGFAALLNAETTTEPPAPAPAPAANRCGECRLGLGVHNSNDPYCDHHRAPSVDSTRVPSLGDEAVEDPTAMIGSEQADTIYLPMDMAVTLRDQMTHLTALLAGPIPLDRFIDRLIANARSLASDTGENTEYDRALVELVASVTPGDPDLARRYAQDHILGAPTRLAPETTTETSPAETRTT